MADSLLDIGGEDIFAFTPDWSTPPGQAFNITRYLQQYPGTTAKITEMNTEVPLIIESDFYFNTKEDEFNFLTFIHDRIGRAKRFWYKYPKTLFRLKDDLSNGSNTIVVHKDYSSLSLQGYERIYFEFDDGDLVTRHITGSDLDDPNEEVELTLATALDRDSAKENVVAIGRILLVRFNEDVFNFKVITDQKSSISLSFYELVKEYSDLAAD
jgi:hypothetical protein